MSNHEVRFPDIEVQLSGEDGNAYVILGLVQRALRRGGATNEEVRAYFAEATADDYDHLLQVTMAWVVVA